MKIQTGCAMPLLLGGASRPTSGGAFEQTLRALERDMWAGAAADESHTHAARSEPSTHAHKAVPQNRFEEASARQTDQRNLVALGPYPDARDDAQFVRTRSDADRTAIGPPLLERLLHADVFAPTAALSPERPEARSCAKEPAVREMDAYTAPSSSAREHQERTSPRAENRTTVHLGDDGMQLVMRVLGASRDEALAISRQTTDDLRRRMAGPVRVVVNGAQNEEVNSHKSPYPAFHGETYGN
ncbi:hypothetical protein AWB80_04389 [Caballeronia pedi]|uniref:Uncharacterized protein n=1 Tax=Caballeronia pedi TaxID=1777141 RepID=A0A158C0K3_9BURK|nr:hypothetical protein [Caballeronia pedi]SAK75878.1 hypothetical protein AWB80_04389 [Caballeronia pedi]